MKHAVIFKSLIYCAKEKKIIKFAMCVVRPCLQTHKSPSINDVTHPLRGEGLPKGDASP